MGGLLTFELDWNYAALYIFKLHPDMDRGVLVLGLDGLIKTVVKPLVSTTGI